MAKEYVPIFFDWLETTQDLSAEEKGHLIDAVILYAKGSDEWFDSLQTSGERIAFRFMRGQVDRNKAISMARSAAGSNKKEQNATNGNKIEQNETKTLNNNNNKNENNNKNKKQKTSLLFDRFWDVYPRHVNKQAAMRAFEKLKVDDELLDTILKAIEKQKTSDQWTKDNGQFIPHPATWLNQRRWEDETTKATNGGKTVSAQAYGQRQYTEEELLMVSDDLIEEARKQRDTA